MSVIILNSKKTKRIISITFDLNFYDLLMWLLEWLEEIWTCGVGVPMTTLGTSRILNEHFFILGVFGNWLLACLASWKYWLFLLAFKLDEKAKCIWKCLVNLGIGLLAIYYRKSRSISQKPTRKASCKSFFILT